MRFELAKAKRNKCCTWCGAAYKMKDFKTRKDKDERDLSGMCQQCIDDTFNGILDPKPSTDWRSV